MERYFLNGKHITEQEAKDIKTRNQEYLNSGNWDLIAKCEFVVEIEVVEPEIQKGEYNETSVDVQKKNADILVTSVDGDYYTLFLNKNIELSIKRGVKRYSERLIAVTESVYNKLRSQYNIAMDF